MKFIPTTIDGVFWVELEPRIDERGYFTRFFAQEEFDRAGINFKMVQTNQAYTKAKGVIRGMHWQVEPKLEAKFFSCLQGEIFDVVCDVRKNSPTYGKWESFNLKPDDFKLLFIPGGLAHGYETLTENCKVQYMVSEFYSPEYEKAFRYDDPTFAIKWPVEPTFLSEKDKNLPLFKDLNL